MAFRYDLLEDDVVVKLTTDLGNGCDIAPLPDNQASYKEVVSKPRILVAYGGSDVGASKSTNEARQDENVSIICSVQWKIRRGENGVYAWIEKVKSSLNGWKYQHGNRFFLKSIEFVERDNDTNIWNFQVLFNLVKLQIQKQADDEGVDYPLLRQVNLIDKVEIP